MTTARTLSIAVVLLAAACSRPDIWDRELGTRQAVPLDDVAAWLVPGFRQVALYDPAADRVRWLDIEAEPTSIHVAPDRKAAVVLDGDGGATWFAIEGERVRTRRYELGAHFEAVTFAPDGERAVIHHDPGQPSVDVVVNANEIAIVDLTKGAGDDNPVRLTLRSFGDVPRAIFVSEPVEIGDRERQFAWALADRYLALFDLAAPEAGDVVVPLALPWDTRSVVPDQIVFGEVEGTLTAFVRASGRDDIFALAFDDDRGGDALPRPYLNVLPTGSGPSDLVFRPTPDGPRVFTVNRGEGSISVIDPITGASRRVEAGVPVSRIIPFRAPREDGGEGESALLWSEGGSSVVFADLDLLERRRGRALTPLTFDGRAQRLAPVPERRQAVATLDNQRLLLLDFIAGTATPLSVRGEPGEVIIEPGGDRAYLYVDSFPPAVAAVDLATGAASAVELPGGDGRLMLVPGARRLVIDHGNAIGDVTVLPFGDLTDAEPRARHGLVLDGVLDR